MLTKKELVAIGVNPDNLTYPHGEMNVIVQQFGYENGMATDYDYETDSNVDVPVTKLYPYVYQPRKNLPVTKLYPDVYQPRRNRIWSCGCENDYIPFETDKDKSDYAKWLRDSAERHKIMAYYLMKQADEIEKFGYPKTDCYYPE